MAEKIFKEFESLVFGYDHLGARPKSNEISQLWFSVDRYNYDYRAMILAYLRELGLEPLSYRINLWNDKFVVYVVKSDDLIHEVDKEVFFINYKENLWRTFRVSSFYTLTIAWLLLLLVIGVIWLWETFGR